MRMWVFEWYGSWVGEACESRRASVCGAGGGRQGLGWLGWVRRRWQCGSGGGVAGLIEYEVKGLSGDDLSAIARFILSISTRRPTGFEEEDKARGIALEALLLECGLCII